MRDLLRNRFVYDDTCKLFLPLYGYMDGAKTKVQDISQYHNNGTIIGAIPNFPGFYFNGTTDYINCGADSSLKPTRVSVAMWVKMLVTPGVICSVIGNYKAATDDGYVIVLRTDKKLRFLIGTDVPPHANVDSSVLDINTWYYVVGVYDGVDMRIYINGNLDCTPAALTGNISDPSTDFTIAHGLALYSANYCKVNVASVCIYNRALSSQEIQNHYQIERYLFGV